MAVYVQSSGNPQCNKQLAFKNGNKQITGVRENDQDDSVKFSKKGWIHSKGAKVALIAAALLVVGLVLKRYGINIPLPEGLSKSLSSVSAPIKRGAGKVYNTIRNFLGKTPKVPPTNGQLLLEGPKQPLLLLKEGKVVEEGANQARRVVINGDNGIISKNIIQSGTSFKEQARAAGEALANLLRKPVTEVEKIVKPGRFGDTATHNIDLPKKVSTYGGPYGSRGAEKAATEILESGNTKINNIPGFKNLELPGHKEVEQVKQAVEILETGHKLRKISNIEEVEKRIIDKSVVKRIADHIKGAKTPSLPAPQKIELLGPGKAAEVVEKGVSQADKVYPKTINFVKNPTVGLEGINTWTGPEGLGSRYGGGGLEGGGGFGG